MMMMMETSTTTITTWMTWAIRMMMMMTTTTTIMKMKITKRPDKPYAWRQLPRRKNRQSVARLQWLGRGVQVHIDRQPDRQHGAKLSLAPLPAMPET